MESQQQQIREQQKQSWNKFSPGWQKWDDFNMQFLKPMGQAIIENLHIKDRDNILDIATGTGEPGLTIAKLIPNGKVTGTDLADGMLLVANGNAASKGLNNYQTKLADVSELPFDNEIFDGISCRMGFMFFPDMQQAANEMYRVLKPGARIAISVWAGPEFNDWVTTIMSIIQKHITLPPPASGSPGMFRCAKPGFIAGLFEQAGFNNVSEKQITGKVDYCTFDLYWEMMLDVGAPIVAALSHADEATKTIIRKEVEQVFEAKNTNGEAVLSYASLIIFANK